LKSFGRDIWGANTMPLLLPNFSQEYWTKELKAKVVPKLEEYNRMLEGKRFLAWLFDYH